MEVWSEVAPSVVSACKVSLVGGLLALRVTVSVWVRR